MLFKYGGECSLVLVLVILCGGRVFIVLCVCVGFVGGSIVRKGLCICVELTGSTKLYWFYFVVVFHWRCGLDIVFFFYQNVVHLLS